jgi:hypothetical protein
VHYICWEMDTTITGTNRFFFWNGGKKLCPNLLIKKKRLSS